MKTPSVILSLFLLASTAASAATVAWTSLPYRSRADSPFASVIGEGRGYVEDFEDHELNTPHLNIVSGNLSASPAYSVDADDGVMNNRGTGWYWFGTSANGPAGPALPDNRRWMHDIRFAPNLLGEYPTFAGAVLMDWLAEGGLSIPMDYFVAFDSAGNQIPGSLLSAERPILPSGIPGDVTLGHRFFGIYSDLGISRILLTGGAFGMDHVQYAYGAIPEPSAAALAGGAMAGMLLRRCRWRSL